MRRRDVLRGGVGVGVGVTVAVAVPGALSGCGLLEDEPPPPDPLEPLMEAKAALAARYAATMTRHPDLGEGLTPLRDAHERHLDTLLDLLVPERRTEVRPKVKPSKSAKGDDSEPSSATTEAPADPVPEDPDAAMTALAAAEKEASARSAKSCLEGAADRAGLLGSISAAEATHVAVLQ